MSRKGYCDNCRKERRDVKSCGQDANGDPDAPDLCFLCRTMKKRAIHLRDIRLRNNGGMNFPLCRANEKTLDLDKTIWPTSSSMDIVTCKHCLLRAPRRYPWAFKKK
jgi:hypothetical protein